MTYNAEGKRTSLQNLAGQVTTTAWDCCHKVSEVQPDGSTTTWDYDDEGRVIASSRLIPLDMTNVTWLTTCYRYDALGRQTATWQTNLAAQVGLPVTRTRYDQLGRVIARVDKLGNTTTTEYSQDGRTVSVRNPNTSTRVTTRSASGDVLSITGTAVTPEFYSYGVLPDGTRWAKTTQGETASSPRFTKRYENLLGQTIREERSGFKGSVLATTHVYDSHGRLVSTSADYEPTVEYTYDTLGNRIATTRKVGAAGSGTTSILLVDAEWRKTETLSSFIIDDNIVWLVHTNIVSCSDSAIAPLVTSSARQLTGLTAATPARSRSTDVRGNVSESRVEFDGFESVVIDINPAQTCRAELRSRLGESVRSVSVSGVESGSFYDGLGRQIASIDGHGKVLRYEYDSFGNLVSSEDSDGNRVSFAFDRYGQIISETNALGAVIYYSYDIRGRMKSESGAVYPVTYDYDVFGNKIAMRTQRHESPSTIMETRWLYDVGSGMVTNKVYSDGKSVKYEYDSHGRLAKRTWARGIETFYEHNQWGDLVRTDYSDSTPSVVLIFDAMGRLFRAEDAAGVTVFLYDSFGAYTNKTIIGAAGTNTIERLFDVFGRDVGYALNGVRQTRLDYDSATGRLATMRVWEDRHPFLWTYNSGSDLKKSLAYPNGQIVNWTYGNRGELLEVDNAYLTNTISKYVYSYDAVNRPVSCSRSGLAFGVGDTYSYFYNTRGELTNATALVDAAYSYNYCFDDIGNREVAFQFGANSVYEVNELNQYIAIDSFTPEYDDDGNQTVVKNDTGLWKVSYNGENRPVRWSCGDVVITMSYDRMGRRVTKNNQSFVYFGHKQIFSNNGNIFIWDPTDEIATHPIAWRNGAFSAYYTCDGNKNVSEMVDDNGDVVAHYEYAPFGAVVGQRGIRAGVNPWRFSSEYADDDIGTVYYNYRHYEPMMGRWMSRDYDEMIFGVNLYEFTLNSPVGNYDWIGLLCENKCSLKGEKRLKSFRYKVYPASWSADIDVNLETDGHISDVLDASTLASFAEGGIKGGLSGAEKGCMASWVQGSIPELGVLAHKQLQILCSGARIWTKVTIEECDCTSCLLFMKRLDWVEDDESDWKLCTSGTMNLPGLNNVFQKPSLKNVKGCVEAHAKELGVK